MLWLLEHEHLSAHEVATTFERRSGLAALAGTGDMRQIVTRDDPAVVVAARKDLQITAECRCLLDEL